jgi:hypothetical protein
MLSEAEQAAAKVISYLQEREQWQTRFRKMIYDGIEKMRRTPAPSELVHRSDGKVHWEPFLYKGIAEAVVTEPEWLELHRKYEPDCPRCKGSG